MMLTISLLLYEIRNGKTWLTKNPYKAVADYTGNLIHLISCEVHGDYDRHSIMIGGFTTIFRGCRYISVSALSDSCDWSID